MKENVNFFVHPAGWNPMGVLAVENWPICMLEFKMWLSELPFSGFQDLEEQLQHCTTLFALLTTNNRKNTLVEHWLVTPFFEFQIVFKFEKWKCCTHNHHTFQLTLSAVVQSYELEGQHVSAKGGGGWGCSPQQGIQQGFVRGAVAKRRHSMGLRKLSHWDFYPRSKIIASRSLHHPRFQDTVDLDLHRHEKKIKNPLMSARFSRPGSNRSRSQNYFYLQPRQLPGVSSDWRNHFEHAEMQCPSPEVKICQFFAIF